MNKSSIAFSIALLALCAFFAAACADGSAEGSQLAASASQLAAPASQLVAPPSQSLVTLLSWNVENLFDAVDDGSEYAEYSVKNGKWNKALYEGRLAKAGQAIIAATEDGRGPDVVCLVETENRAVLDALADGPLKACAYAYRMMVPAEGSATNCGILSRFPLTNQSAHNVAEGKAAPGSGKPQVRNIIEAEIDIEGRPLVLFVNHWKSKTEGAKETEEMRIIGASVLKERIESLLAARPNLDIVAAGDFNENANEYARVDGSYQTAFLSYPIGKAKLADFSRRSVFILPESELSGAQAALSAYGGLALASPWLDDEREGEGSYWYSGNWESIDNFLFTSALMDDTAFRYASFRTLKADFLLNNKEKPFGWDVRKRDGYSDHLPIILELSLN